MIEKILGVACLIAAGLMYGAKNIALAWGNVAQAGAPSSNSGSLEPLWGTDGYVVALTILGVLLIVGAYWRLVNDWAAKVRGEFEIEQQPASTSQGDTENRY